MLTAAVRDLHQCYPRRFVTDICTSCAELWDHNPYVTPLSETDPTVELIDCSYPLINRCNGAPYHCLHGFIDFLNEKLGLKIHPTQFRGDIHLSPLEKSWYSQVYELTDRDIPFWIIAAGGKHDITIKWWSRERYQQVVDHFRGRIQFVQVGGIGHHHPRLDGVIDLRGRTTLRELVRLVYHSEGALCSVTSLMHLAAAVELRHGQESRACVVVAGGREPAHWEAYPNHQFIHDNGALACCSHGGCWKDRVKRLGDGDLRDQPDRLCMNLANGLPRCMDMITADEVCRRIETYHQGGRLRYLSAGEFRAARKAVSSTKRNRFDWAPLTLGEARLALEEFIPTIADDAGNYHGRGIVICAGGVDYFTNAWVCINMLRHLGCQLPIQLWHLRKEMDREMAALVASLGVECVDAAQIRRRQPVRKLGGWELKPYALLYCPFEQVLLLDADNVPVMNPEYLFDAAPFRKTGAVFWPDWGRSTKATPIWRSCDVRRPSGPEFESGQILVDKSRCWRALRLSLWFNENSDFYYQYLHGDKETFHLAFARLKQPYTLVPTPIHRLESTLCQHDFHGRRIFQHRNSDKWNLALRNKEIADFQFEPECRRFIRRLQQVWDGRSTRFQSWMTSPDRRRMGTSRGPRLRIKACMISHPERTEVRQGTLESLARTDWGEEPALIQIDSGNGRDRRSMQARTALHALRQCEELPADYVLFLEDDLEFNHHLRWNLEHWMPLQKRAVTLGGLYNPGLRMLARNVNHQFSIAVPTAVFGSQAFLISQPVVRFLVKHWNTVQGMQDIRMSRLAARLKKPIFYYSPSLVQHVGEKSTWGGYFHQARDFDPHWRARGAADQKKSAAARRRRGIRSLCGAAWP